MTDSAAAAALAEDLLAQPLPRRWAHTQGVAQAARELAPLAGPDADLLEASAWLHDIGYAPAIALTGFHPLDGARHLRGLRYDADVISLVANHTNSRVEAEEWGLLEELAEFPVTEAAERVGPLLARCDMTTSPDGLRVTVAERLAEIYSRYPSDHIVHRSIARGEHALRGLEPDAHR